MNPPSLYALITGAAAFIIICCQTSNVVSAIRMVAFYTPPARYNHEQKQLLSLTTSRQKEEGYQRYSRLCSSSNSWACIAEFSGSSSTEEEKGNNLSVHEIDYPKRKIYIQTNNTNFNKSHIDLSKEEEERKQEFDIMSPREWMESITLQEEHQEFGGAYTVLRCDILSPQPPTTAESNDESFILWGEEFHLNRLVSSYRQLQQLEGGGRGGGQEKTQRKKEVIAIQQSQLIISTLIEKAILTLYPNATPTTKIMSGDVGPTTRTDKDFLLLKSKVIMITLLWTSPSSSTTGTKTTNPTKDKIVVRGHAFCANIKAPPTNPMTTSPNHINVTIAIPNTKTSGGNIQNDNSAIYEDILDSRQEQGELHHQSFLPSRQFTYPEAKLSIWCTSRRPIETTFKPTFFQTRHEDGSIRTTTTTNHNNIGEVLLTRPTKKVGTQNTIKYEWELLEGLTSNLFVLCKDGTLRTTTKGVLQGYSQKLVLDAAKRCGIKTLYSSSDNSNRNAKEGEEKENFISLENVSMWKEAFVTSSIRLIIPIDRIYIPEYDNDQEDETSRNVSSWKEVARLSSDDDANEQDQPPVWKRLYESILSHQLR